MERGRRRGVEKITEEEGDSLKKDKEAERN